MKPYGSRREDVQYVGGRWKSDPVHGLKSSRARAKRTVECDESGPTCACGAPASWSYTPGEGDYCDACVPRGCSCTEDPQDPCCEYMPVD